MKFPLPEVLAPRLRLDALGNGGVSFGITLEEVSPRTIDNV
jgi:hypothetical protein